MGQTGMGAPVSSDAEEPRAEMVLTPNARRIPHAGAAIVLALMVLVVGLVELFPTFRTAYAYDDLDCLNLAADVLAGKASYWEAVLRPHNEHFLPLLRVAFHASASWFGINPTPFRLVVFVAHVTTAWLLGLLALHYTGRAAGAFAAGLAYVLPGGLSSMMLWAVTAAGPPIGLLGLSAALLALAHRDTLGVLRARLLAGAGCVFALLAGSGLMPLLAGPLLLDEYERRRGADRRRFVGPFAVFCLLAMVTFALATALLYAHFYGHRPELKPIKSIPRAAFLLVITPYRYVLPGLGLPIGGSRLGTVLLWLSLGLAIAAPVAALLIALWRRGVSPLARIALMTFLGPLGVLLLVGAGRWNWSPFELFEADRYFFVLLLPLALLVGAAAAAAVDRMNGWTSRQRTAILALCAVAFGAELVLHRRAVLGRVPFDIFAAHERRFAQLSGLADSLSAAASKLPPGSPPLLLPDDELSFHDVHNRRVSARMLLHVIASDASRLGLASGPVSARDAGILNPVFAAWGHAIGEPKLAPRVVDGRLTKPKAGELVDFRQGPEEPAVLAGFYPWEGTYRWMGQRGELRLTLTAPSLQLVLAAPISQLRAARGWSAIALSVTAIDETTNTAVTLGTIRVNEDGPRAYAVDASPFLLRFRGRSARLVLEADRTWRPTEVLPGSQDPRNLSVILVTAGSAPP